MKSTAAKPVTESVKIVRITSCGTCPYRQEFTGGRRLACNHQSVAFLKPYSQDRHVDPDVLSADCPLP